MIDCCINSNYIKPDTDTSDDMLDRYLAYLLQEKSQKTASNTISTLRRCMEVLGKDIGEVGEDDIERLKKHFSNLSGRSIESYVGAVRRYRYFCTGIEDEKVKGSMTYAPEVRRLWDKLRAEGDSPHIASEKVSKLNSALKVLEDNEVSTMPNQISVETLMDLDALLGERTRKEKLPLLKALGWYVLANTGRNPYQEYMERTSPLTPKDTRPCRFEEDLVRFRDSLYERDLSEKRKDALVRAARCALNIMDDMFGTDYTVETITRSRLVRFRRETTGLKESTRREYLQALGMLIDFKTGTDLVRLCRFRFTKTDQKRVFITEDDVNRMYRNADSEERLMLAMGISEAMRRGEISGMKFSNIKDGNFEFWSKGFGPDGKLSILPIMDDVDSALKKYMAKRETIAGKWGDYDPDAILLNAYGKPMSGDSLYHRLKDLAERSGVENFTPHSLRRFAASNMRKNGASIPDIACALRHEDPVTTMRCYLKDDPEVKAMTLAKASKGLFAS